MLILTAVRRHPSRPSLAAFSLASITSLTSHSTKFGFIEREVLITRDTREHARALRSATN